VLISSWYCSVVQVAIVMLMANLGELLLYFSLGCWLS
jgi:hypothetical protein